MAKVILVTGGNRGIGLEICLELARKGQQVILGARNPDFDLGNQKSNLIDAHQLDVTDSRSIEELVQYVSKKYHHLDVLINNAGIGIGNKGSVDANLKEVSEIMNTNFFGAWELSKACLPLLVNSTQGRIINMSSGMGALADLTSGYAGYRLSKSALNALTILMANELMERKIKVNAMCPGWVRTDMGGSGAPRSVEQGADTAVWLALEEKIPNGKFIRDRKVISW